MQNFIFPEANAILDEAKTRHRKVWPFAIEAIDLAHRAFERGRDSSSKYVPGVPKIVRARNDINDDCWRFLRSVAEPLLDAGYIREFTLEDGGEVLILPDGLPVRLKKGDGSGATSNYPTPKIKMSRAATRTSLFQEATELDKYIQDGLGIDIVYVAGNSMSEYEKVGLRYMNASISPLVIIDPPTQNQLLNISPAALELVTAARKKLQS